MNNHLCLTHNASIGDIIVMTSLVRDIQLAHPGRWQISVQTPAKTLWQNNPYVVRTPSNQPIGRLRLDYGSYIRRETWKNHFLVSFYDFFERRMQVSVPVTAPKPDIHLSEQEKANRLVDGRYWVILSGGKTDFTTKHWVYDRHQKVINSLRKCGLKFVQAGSAFAGQPGTASPAHYHPKLEGVLDLVGKTNLRDMLSLIYHAEGVICTITMAMHMAAALDKPCVVTAGGREEAWWEGYTNQLNNFREASGKVKVEHRYLHTIGKLNCCESLGCWKSKVLASESPPNKNKHCVLPVLSNEGQRVPKCMDMIQAEHVVEAVMSYYKDGILAPIGPVPTIILPEAEEAPIPTATVDLKTITERAASNSKNIPIALKAHRPPKSEKPVKKPEEEKTASSTLLDHPSIGGKLTVFVLCYGDYFDLHKRCLSSLLSSRPTGHLDLRVGSNELGARSRELINDLVKSGYAYAHYEHKSNDRKYPVMREMFYDASRPIHTPWTLWLDDDTMTNKHPQWLELLAAEIIKAKPEVGAIGPKYHYSFSPGQRDWVKRAPWYKGRMFYDVKEREAPNGTKAFFVSGSLIAFRTQAIKDSDIPDSRLEHHGDFMLGEQLHQNGYKIAHWCGKKEFVNWSSHPRRGLSEKHPGK